MKKSAAVLLILASCVPTKDSVSPVVVPPPSAPTNGEEILAKGWSKDYTAYIVNHLTPAILNFPAPSLCPKFNTLTPSEHKDFWAAVLESTAKPESDFDRFNTYKETGLGIDPVTGKTIVSAGLLQVSYGDSLCKNLFDYKKDQTLPKEKQSIFNPYLNLQCGINIWDGLIKKYGNAPTLFSVGGHYWSTVRDHKIDSYFKKRMPKCI